MRNPWQRGGADDGSRRDRASEHPETASPNPFGTPGDSEDTGERVDPADLLAIRADDELLDALASGRSGGSFPQFDGATERLRPAAGADLGGYSDDQAIFAMLQSWRDDVNAEPIPELITLDEAAAAIKSGRRPRRRLVPVAAAAAVAVFALAGVGVAAGSATPDSPLWGLSTMLNAQRAHSVQASYNADIALVAAQKALESGDVAGAEAELARAEPQLSQIKDTQKKRQLAARHANLAETAKLTQPGESVRTDSLGAPVDRDSDPRYRNHHWHKGDSDSDSDESGNTPGRPGNPDHSSDWPFPGQDPRTLHSDDPTKPGGPSDSTKPDGSDGSTKPGGPSDSTKPDGSDGSTKPGGPNDASKPGGPSDSTKPGGSDGSTKPGGPSDSTKPDGSDGSTKPGGPSDSSKPGDPSSKPSGGEAGNGSGGTHTKPNEPSHEKPTSDKPQSGGSDQGGGSGQDNRGGSSGDSDTGSKNDDKKSDDNKRDDNKRDDDKKSDDRGGDRKGGGDRHGGGHDGGGGDRDKGGGGGGHHGGGGHSEGGPDPAPTAGPASDNSLSDVGSRSAPVV